MRIVFKNIPIQIENPTKPLRYSFFSGLKNVFTKRDKDNNRKNALLSEKKNSTIPTGISKNQNFIKSKGSEK